jgi:hypothetical protein
MTLKNIMEKVKNVLSFLLPLYQGVRSYLISCFPTVRAIGVSLYQRFIKNLLIEPMCRICKRMNWNCGIVLAIGLLLLVLIGWMV